MFLQLWRKFGKLIGHISRPCYTGVRHKYWAHRTATEGPRHEAAEGSPGPCDSEHGRAASVRQLGERIYWSEPTAVAKEGGS